MLISFTSIQFLAIRGFVHNQFYEKTTLANIKYLITENNCISYLTIEYKILDSECTNGIKQTSACPFKFYLGQATSGPLQFSGIELPGPPKQLPHNSCLRACCLQPVHIHNEMRNRTSALSTRWQVCMLSAETLSRSSVSLRALEIEAMCSAKSSISQK